MLMLRSSTTEVYGHTDIVLTVWAMRFYYKTGIFLRIWKNGTVLCSLIETK